MKRIFGDDEEEEEEGRRKEVETKAVKVVVGL